MQEEKDILEMVAQPIRAMFRDRDTDACPTTVVYTKSGVM